MGDAHAPLQGGEIPYPWTVFHGLIKHERLRADREGAEFSLIVLGSISRPNDPRPVDSAELIASLREKIRAMDEVGWISADADVGVLLPATSYEGACEFASAVRKRILRQSSFSPSIAVYSYPTHWFQNDRAIFRACRTELVSLQAPRRASFASSTKACGGELAPPGLFESIIIRGIPAWKRAFDIVGAVTGLVILSPAMLLTAAYIKVVSPGPVVFRQQRVGYKGKTFTFLKFRTMRRDNDDSVHAAHVLEIIRSNKPAEKLDGKGDRRIIFGGRVLRRSCIDELPQLINVLRGDMSLVGPRPCLPYEAEVYSRWQSHRFDILPGMSGLWQVSGYTDLTFPQMIRLDIQYARHMSLLLDAWIIARTAPAIVRMTVRAMLRRLAERLRVNRQRRESMALDPTMHEKAP